MKTVEWKGTTLTAVSANSSTCGVRLKSGKWIDCFMDKETSTACTPVCPGGCNILLEGDDLNEYLAAKLMGEGT